MSAVRAPIGRCLGAACLVTTDGNYGDTPTAGFARRNVGEMALELRNSLATISGYAQQLAANRDPELAQQLAADIAAESAHLDVQSVVFFGRLGVLQRSPYEFRFGEWSDYETYCLCICLFALLVVASITCASAQSDSLGTYARTSAQGQEAGRGKTI